MIGNVLIPSLGFISLGGCDMGGAMTDIPLAAKRTGSGGEIRGG
jgi:hypothetical protein